MIWVMIISVVIAALLNLFVWYRILIKLGSIDSALSRGAKTKQTPTHQEVRSLYWDNYEEAKAVVLVGSGPLCCKECGSAGLKRDPLREIEEFNDDYLKESRRQ